MPLAMNRSEIASIATAGVAILFHIASIASHAVSQDEDYIDDYNDKYYDEHGHWDYFMNPAGWAAIILGSLALILWIIATPVAFMAGRGYLSRRGTSGRRITGWSIAAWVIYGFNTFSGVGAVIAGAAGGEPSLAWNILLLFWALVQFSFMITFAELARRSNEPAMTNVALPQPCYPTQVPAARAERFEPVVEKFIEKVPMSDGSYATKITTTTTHPDGSKTVEVTTEEQEVKVDRW